MALVIDRAAEDAVFAELEALGVGAHRGLRGARARCEIAGGGPVHVVIDPIDGSLNAKRGLPLYALSIAVAERADDGRRRRSATSSTSAAARSGGPRAARAPSSTASACAARRRAAPLEILGLESARPAAGRRRAPMRSPRPARAGARCSARSRCRSAGSPAARFDGDAQPAPVRSVDAAAAS